MSYFRAVERATAKKRYFIRFGEMPANNRSKLWTAPNAYYASQVGKELPGVSVYEVRKSGRKWEVITDELSSGSGMSSLAELLYMHSENKKLPIYLLTGVPVRWKDLDREEQKEFEDYYPGRRAEHYDLQGTDGEPLIREHVIVKQVTAKELSCKILDH